MSIWFESKWPWKSNLEVKIDVLLVYFYYIRNNYIIFFPWFVLMNDWGLSVDNSFSTKDNCSAIGIPLYPTSGKYFCAAYEQGFQMKNFHWLFVWSYSNGCTEYITGKRGNFRSRAHECGSGSLRGGLHRQLPPRSASSITEMEIISANAESVPLCHRIATCYLLTQ